MIKRLVATFGVVGVLLGFAAVPASADKPVEFEATDVFDAINPCTGENHTITIDLVIRDHVGHKNNFTGIARRTGTTSDGFILQSGHDHLNDNKNGFRVHLNDRWVNRDTGAKFQARAIVVVNFNQEELKVDKFDLRCIGAPTILPESQA